MSDDDEEGESATRRVRKVLNADRAAQPCSCARERLRWL